MANITQTIPSLTAGISQQPDEQKIPGQVKDLENALPDVTHGLLKRPAGKFVGDLTGAENDGKWFHYYRDENEQYIGQVHRDGVVKMWACTQVKDSAGNVIHEAGASVNVVDGIGNATYLTHTKDSDIQTLTLNDFTYITNRTINTAMDETSAGLVDAGNFEKEVYVELKTIAYAKQYGLNLFDNTTTDTETRTTATRISVPSSRLDNDSTCPSVGTEIFNVGTGDDVHQNITQEFLFKNLDVGTSEESVFFRYNNTVDYNLYYCPPQWATNTFYRVGDLVTGRTNLSVYKLTAIASGYTGLSTGNTEPSAINGGDSVIGENSEHTWTHVSDEIYTAQSNVASRQLYHSNPCIKLTDHRQVNDSGAFTALLNDWKDATANPKYSDLPFTLENPVWEEENASNKKAAFNITWKHFGYYDDHINRIILVRPSPENGEKTIGGCRTDQVTSVGEIELKSTGWSTDNVLGDGRSDLYFRITNTGQAIPDDTGDNYSCRYTTTVDLLHGGSGWQIGDRIRVNLNGGTHVIQVDAISTSEVRANLGLIRPAPTSFDTKTTVTADSILGDMRNAIIAEDGFDAANVEQIGSGLYIKKTAKFSASTPVGELLNVVASQVNDIGDLPSQCKHGMVVEVVNSAADEDNHYVKFFGNLGINLWEADKAYIVGDKVLNDDGKKYVCDQAGTSNSSGGPTGTGLDIVDNGARWDYAEIDDNDYLDGVGVWEECAEPGRKKRFDYAKMPVALIRGADGNFYLTTLNGTDNHYPKGGVVTIDVEENVASTLTTDIVDIVPRVHNSSSSYWVDPGVVIKKINNDGTHITTIDLYPKGDSRNGMVEVGNVIKVQEKDLIGGTSTSYVTIATVTSIYGPKAPLWEDALVGDDVTNPEPSFIGKPINNMLFFRNRLALLSEENIILSRPGDFFNFFATSAIQFIPSDPIDVSASSTYPATLYDGIQVNAGLILFTKNQQFMLTTDSDILSVQTVKINSIATYNFNSDTNPISLGTTIGFLDNANKHSRFFEMASALREGEPEVIEQSAVVSKLFDNDLKLISNSRENSVIFFSEADSNTLYGYKYFDQINQRKLASWFKWTVEGTIKYHCMQDDNLFVVIKNSINGTNYSLLRFPLKQEELFNSSGELDTTLTIHGNYEVHLDYLDYVPEGDESNITGIGLIYAGSYDDNTGISTFTNIPTVINNHPLFGTETTSKLFAYYSNNVFEPITAGLFGLNENTQNDPGKYGLVYKVTENGSNVLKINTLKGKIDAANSSWLKGKFLIGTPYTMKVDIPTLYYQKQSGERWVADTRADTILHRVKLGFGTVGNYKASIKCTGKTDFNQDVTIENVFVPELSNTYPREIYHIGILDDNNLTTIPIYNRNINTSLTIESTHPTPMTLHNLTWEGSYTDKNYSRV